MEFFFEWDAAKAALNEKKHGVPFDHVLGVFKDPLALTIFDDEHSQNEERWVTIGRTSAESIIVVVHTFQALGENEAKIRIVSARKPTKTEKLQYLET